MLAIANSNLPPALGWACSPRSSSPASRPSSCCATARRRRRGLTTEPLSRSCSPRIVGLALVVGVAVVHPEPRTQPQHADLVAQGRPDRRPDHRVLLVLWTFVLGRTALRPAHLRGRRQPRSGPPRRHQRRPHPHLRLRDLLDAWRRSAASWRPAGPARSTPNTGGSNVLLYAVGAAVIGGTSLFGGKGRVIDAVLGGAVVAVIDNGMGLMDAEAQGTSSSSPDSSCSLAAASTRCPGDGRPPPAPDRAPRVGSAQRMRAAPKPGGHPPAQPRRPAAVRARPRRDLPRRTRRPARAQPQHDRRAHRRPRRRRPGQRERPRETGPGWTALAGRPARVRPGLRVRGEHRGRPVAGRPASASAAPSWTERAAPRPRGMSACGQRAAPLAEFVKEMQEAAPTHARCIGSGIAVALVTPGRGRHGAAERPARRAAARPADPARRRSAVHGRHRRRPSPRGPSTPGAPRPAATTSSTCTATRGRRGASSPAAAP